MALKKRKLTDKTVNVGNSNLVHAEALGEEDEFEAPEPT